MTQALKIKYLLQLPPHIYMSSFKTVHKEKCTLSPKKHNVTCNATVETYLLL